MANSTNLLDYLGRGTHAARPTSPPIGSGALAAYYETDTGNTFVWSGSAWVQINAAAGSTTLAGDTDVSISSPSNGQVLTYNSATSKWTNQAASGGSSDTALTFASNTHVTTSTLSDGFTQLVPAANYYGIQADQTIAGAANLAIRMRMFCRKITSGSDSLGFVIANSSGFGYLGESASAGAAQIYKVTGQSVFGSSAGSATFTSLQSNGANAGTNTAGLVPIVLWLFVHSSTDIHIMLQVGGNLTSYSDASTTLDFTTGTLNIGVYMNNTTNAIFNAGVQSASNLGIWPDF